MSAKVKINLEKSWFSPGEQITGMITLNVPAHIDCSRILITINGWERSRICAVEKNKKSNKDEEKNYEDKTEYLNDIFIIETFKDDFIAQGYYQYPFEITLPQNLPSSFYIEKDVTTTGKSSGKIRYKIIADQIHIDKSIIKEKMDIIIVQSKTISSIKKETTEATPLEIGKDDGEIWKENREILTIANSIKTQVTNTKALFFNTQCCGKKLISIKSTLEKEEFVNRDPIIVSLQIKNTSSKILNVDVKFVQKVSLLAKTESSDDSAKHSFTDILYRVQLGDFKSDSKPRDKKVELRIPPIIQSSVDSVLIKNIYKVIVVGTLSGDNTSDIVDELSCSVFKLPIVDSYIYDSPIHRDQISSVIAKKQVFELTIKDSSNLQERNSQHSIKVPHYCLNRPPKVHIRSKF